MLGGVRFLPRDSVSGAAGNDEKDAEPESKKSSKKRKHGSKKDRKSKERSKHKHNKEEKNEYSDESSEDSEDLRGRRRDRGEQESKRKEAGLEWMNLAPERPPTPVVKDDEDVQMLEAEKPVNKVKELNPFWKNDGSGIPTDNEVVGMQPTGRGRLPTPPGVGDGGASWRMKALKRAQEQAAREGRKLDEVQEAITKLGVVEERWGSLASLTTSVAVQRAAHANAHLHARRDRQRDSKPTEVSEGGRKGDTAAEREDEDEKRMQTTNRDYLKDVKAKDNRMRAPQVDRSLSWRNSGRDGKYNIRPEDAAVLRSAASTYNKFNDDGNFLKSMDTDSRQGEVDTTTRISTVVKTTMRVETTKIVKDSNLGRDNPDSKPQAATVTTSVTRVEGHSSKEAPQASNLESESRVRTTTSVETVLRMEARSVGGSSKPGPGSDAPRGVDSRFDIVSERKSEGSGLQLQGLSSNQVAAKVMQLKLRGKHKEAEELQKQFDASQKTEKEAPLEEDRRESMAGPSQILARLELVGKKTLETRRESADRNMAGTISGNKLYRADDEYDDLGPLAERKKKRNKERGQEPPTIQSYNRIQTQQERCSLCFDNANRPKHLTIAIANFTYLTLPPKRSLVPGHCYIVPMQHEGATRNVDDGTWEELRNFKKCLVRMFDGQDKEAIFLETAMHLSRQKRHCVVECIPIPASFSKQAPLYFKKAIEEAESEWSQHNAKKLIDTRTKGLRSSVPKNFPYFHVEFGLGGGYAHVIDDESQFKPQFGREVLQGILQIEEQETNQYTPSEIVVKDFAKMWQPHDWTKMLD